MPFGEGKHHIRQNEGLETTCSNCSQNRIHLVMLSMSYGSPDVTLQQYTHQYQTKYWMPNKKWWIGAIGEKQVDRLDSRFSRWGPLYSFIFYEHLCVSHAGTPAVAKVWGPRYPNIDHLLLEHQPLTPRDVPHFLRFRWRSKHIKTKRCRK
jgi:hypothetical protein